MTGLNGSKRVAVVHDWLTGMRGGEYVLEAILELFPSADLFTLIHVEGSVSKQITSHPIHTSALQQVPGIEKKYRHFLPLMPSLIERFDLSNYDLIVSSSHCVAKGVRKSQHATHVSYVHAPMRYVWDRFDDYFSAGKTSFPVRFAARAVRGYLRNWDRKVSQSDRVDALIANSSFIASRIQEAYGRSAQVIHPFADLSRFQPENHLKGESEPQYLMVGAFAPYKKTEIAIEAFNRMDLPLWIVGSGQDESKLRSAAGPKTKFLGSLTNQEIATLYGQSRAFVFPGVEDFGITPIEAMASGLPVLAYAAGGALETVTESTGIFFHEQSVEALIEAVKKFEALSADKEKARSMAQACVDRASKFTKSRFQQELIEVIEQTIK